MWKSQQCLIREENIKYSICNYKSNFDKDILELIKNNQKKPKIKILVLVIYLMVNFIWNNLIVRNDKLIQVRCFTFLGPKVSCWKSKYDQRREYSIIVDNQLSIIKILNDKWKLQKLSTLRA